MSKRYLRLSRGGAVKASLLMFGMSILAIGCGQHSGIEHEIGNSTSAPCTAFYCSSTGTGGHTGAAGNGGMGGHAGSGGSTTSVGGSGGTSTGTGGSGGSAGATHSGGAGGFGGNTTTNTGGSAGATNVGGSGGSGGMTTTGTGGQGGAITTTTDAGVGGSGGASTTTTDAGAVCTIDQKGCNNVCVAKNDPAFGCSIFACSPCAPIANAVAACGQNQDCVIGSCNVGFNNCDNNAANGCESPSDSDPNNCGTCGTVCAVNSLCQSGKCVQQPLNSFSCSGWTRDPLFDAFKIPDQNNLPADVQLVGGIWGTSGDDFYISAATYAKGVVAHWYGGAFHREDLPGVTTIYGIWGSGPDDVWVTGYDGSKGLLFHRDAQGAWTLDPNRPVVKRLGDIWGADSNNVFLMGQDPGVGRVWKKSGANWINLNLPSPKQPGDLGFSVSKIWGFDATHVFVTGYRFDNASNAVGGVFWFYNGVSWKIVQVPVEAMELTGVHGTSPQDLFVTGHGVVVGGKADSYVYRVTNSMVTWTPFTRPSFGGYGPVRSLKGGTFVAAGIQLPVGAGALRITTSDQVDVVQFYAVDNKAYGPVAFWEEPGSLKVHLIGISPPNGSLASHYVGNCK